MKLLLLCCLVVLAAAAPRSPESYASPSDVQIVKQDYENDGSGNYKYAYEQSDGTKGEAQGTLTGAGEDVALAVKGVYSFVIDGIKYTVTYTADENGYQPEIEQGPGGAVPPGVVASLLGAG